MSRRLELLLAAGLTLLLIVDVASIAITRTSQVNATYYQAKEQKQPEHIKSPIVTGFFAGWHGFFDFVERKDKAIVALSTFFIFVFTLTLWRATNGLLAHGREVERAYVSGGGPINHETGCFDVTIDNYGKTPAELLEIRIGFGTLDNLPAQPVYEHEVFLHSRIQPGIRGHVVAHVPIPLYDEDPCVFGEFIYRDIFLERHKFRFLLGIVGGGTKGVRARHPAYVEWD